MKFNVGDVVRLNSGGPDMTIREIQRETAWCQWISESKIYEADFPIKSLQRSKEISGFAVISD